MLCCTHPEKEVINLPAWKTKSPAVQKATMCLPGKLKSHKKEKMEEIKTHHKHLNELYAPWEEDVMFILVNH